MRFGVTVCAVALSLQTVLFNPAHASEQSKRLYSRGLVDLHAHRNAEALQLFNQAVEADPRDPYALYYRGVTRGRLGDMTGAIADLRTVVATKTPGLKQATLDLGVALVQTGAYAEAVPLLTEAQQVHGLDAQASLFLGIAQLRLDQTQAARATFEKAAALDPTLQLSARYYLGVIDYREGSVSRAKDDFSAVVRASPNSDMGREAAQFLENIRRGAGGEYQLYGLVGLQYDSNVILAPSTGGGGVENALGVSNQADGRFVLNAGGFYSLWRNDQAEWSVGYDFYQSLHFHLTQFNLEDHRPSTQFAMKAGPVQFGVVARYDYYLLSVDSFLEEVSGVPWLTVPEGDFGRTEAFYRARWRQFYQMEFSDRDAFNQAVGFRQVVYLNTPDRYLFAGYQYDHEGPTHGDMESQSFGYNGNQVEGGLGWVFPYEVFSEFSYAYRHEIYYTQSDGRRDNDHQMIVSLRKPLTAHFDLIAAYLGTIDNSNKDLFNYQRYIGSLALQVRL